MSKEKPTAPPVVLSQEQFTELLSRISISTMANKNFTRCTLRFDGEFNHNKLEEFVSAIEVYKQIENISDDEALTGLPLLLQGTASTWWQGVRAETKTWASAMKNLRSAFAPPKQPHDIYMELFSCPQAKAESIDAFLCRKRALLGQLPSKRHKEEEQIDFIYGQLKLTLRKKIARSDIKNFAELIEKARHLETLTATDDGNIPTLHKPNVATNKSKRCLFCSKKGHVFDECRKRLFQLKKEESKEIINEAINKEIGKPVITCYGCGSPGVFRSNCLNCKSKETPPKPVAFYRTEIALQDNIKIPTIEVTIKNQQGYAYLDTAARTSIAGTKLYNLLLQSGVEFGERTANITLADGKITLQKLLTTNIDVTIGNRTMPITFSVIPNANDNRTLLGIDFLETAGIILNLPQRYWYFLDNPKEHFEFLQLKNHIPILKAAKQLDFDSYEEKGEIQNFLHWANELKMLSPIPDSPPPRQDDSSPPKKPRWQLIQLESPFPPPRPREPADINSYIDPRIDYVPINPTQLYSVDILLHPNKGHLMSNNEKNKFNNLIEEFKDVFATKGEPTSYIEHKIDTEQHNPISVKPYRLSPFRQQQLRAKLDDMINNNIVEECDSSWCSPVILVPKGENDVRVCIDFRKLNEITVPDRYPLPRIDNLLHQAKAMPFMSTIDLQSGFWQIKVHPDDQDKTAFISPFGMYRFKRMPFGLRNAPATFQRLMDKFVHGLKAQCVLAYLDDLIVRSSTFEQHLHDLREVFEKLRKFRLRANREKCRFGCSKIKYLGHLIVPEGIETDPEKISAITDRTEPKNLKQLISFLQTASWYRRFIENFAEIAKPLTNLTKKNRSWQWKNEQKQSYKTLQEALTSAPILKQADFEKPFTIKTDASNYAIGAALLQGEGPQEHPIEYASRLLTPAERNYTVTEKEALAIVWAVAKFRGYIEGSKFITVTDHQPLKWLLNLKSPTGRLARWALQLQPYNLEIKYSPGKTNILADTLSRPPCVEDHDTRKCEICTLEYDLPNRSENNIRNEQIKDENLKVIIKTLEDQAESEDYAHWSKRGFLLNKGVLYRFAPDQENENAKLVVPKHEVKNVLKSYHDAPTAGHLGVERTVKRIENNFFWKGLRKDVIQYVKTCIECQKYKPTNQKPAGLFQPTANGQRFEILSIDLFGPLPRGLKDEKWIFIIEDTASRWVELFALTEATAQQCALTLLNEVLLRYGLPRRISSDNGTQFVSAIMQQLTFCLDIQQFMSPVYHPEPNIVERKNRDLKSQIAIMVQNKHNKWPETLPAIRFSMNSAYNRSTGYSAAYLTFGRELRTPFENSHNFSEVVQSENFIPEITPYLRQLSIDLTSAKLNVETTQDNNRKRANQKRRPDPGYNIGDMILVETHPISRQDKQFSAKLAPRRDGPYVIIKKHGSSIYEVANMDSPEKSIGRYHTSAMVKFENRENEIPAPIIPIRRRGRPKKIAPACS